MTVFLIADMGKIETKKIKCMSYLNVCMGGLSCNTCINSTLLYAERLFEKLDLRGLCHSQQC